MTRAEKVARAQELRAQGLVYREIAAELGVAPHLLARETTQPMTYAIHLRRCRPNAAAAARRFRIEHMPASFEGRPL